MTGAVVFATEQGLGRQAKSFFDHGVFQEVLVWEHSHYVNHYEWYPNRVKSFDDLLAKCDKIMFFELPHDWKHIIRAREKKVKTILFAMYECTRFPFPYFPDVIAGGSVLEAETYPDVPVKVINVPAPDEIKWKLRKKANVFLHNAGHGGLLGRNGTKELLQALQYVKSPIKLLIRSQVPVVCHDPRVEVKIGDLPYEHLFDEGDVFVYPDKFGGSCLPIQEAHSAGLCVMASNRHPLNTWLPTEPLIPIKGYKKEKISIPIDTAIVDPQDIAKTIDEWYGKDITKYSLAGKKWAEDNSWANLKKQYEAL